MTNTDIHSLLKIHLCIYSLLILKFTYTYTHTYTYTYTYTDTYFYTYNYLGRDQRGREGEGEGEAHHGIWRRCGHSYPGAIGRLQVHRNSSLSVRLPTAL